MCMSNVTSGVDPARVSCTCVAQERVDSLQKANLFVVDNISGSLFQQEEEGVLLTSFPGVNEMLGELKERVRVGAPRHTHCATGLQCIETYLLCGRYV